jgi:hypothetical protein
MKNLDIQGLVPVWHCPRFCGDSLDDVIAVGEIRKDGDREYYLARSGVIVTTTSEANAFMQYGTIGDFHTALYQLKLEVVDPREFAQIRRHIDYNPTIGLNIPMRDYARIELLALEPNYAK